jgi:DNA-binding NarL/FixJ family response regulator
MSITVFLADDHTVVRDGLRFMLEAQSDIEVVGDAATGREAVVKVSTRCPEIVILDITMPDLNGIEATRQVLEVCPATQVIILSMHSTGEHVFQALKAGARGYRLKESAGAEVVHAVRAVRRGRRYLSEKISERLVDDYVRERELSDRSPLARLSQREREVLQLVVEGRSSADIATLLYLSPKTVDTYRSRLMHKLGIRDLPSLVKYAIQHGLTPLD